MWDWINCFLCARHEYCVWSEPGTVCLRCIHCGRRSNGWQLGEAAEGHAAESHHLVAETGPGGRLLRWAFRRSAHAH